MCLIMQRRHYKRRNNSFLASEQQVINYKTRTEMVVRTRNRIIQAWRIFFQGEQTSIVEPERLFSCGIDFPYLIRHGKKCWSKHLQNLLFSKITNFIRKVLSPSMYLVKERRDSCIYKEFVMLWIHSLNCLCTTGRKFLFIVQQHIFLNTVWSRDTFRNYVVVSIYFWLNYIFFPTCHL